MYGMPQPNTYGQYAFSGYGGFPNQAGGTPGGGAPGAPGMPQAATGGGLGLAPGGQAPGADGAAGQAGQAQWAADPSSYYSNYWGGVYCLPFDFMGRELIWLILGYYGQQAAGQQPGVDAQMAAP